MIEIREIMLCVKMFQLEEEAALKKAEADLEMAKAQEDYKLKSETVLVLAT